MTSPQRTDIQALRGIAVLLVLAHHARVPLIHGGYLGVDIFFVLSGFLITTLVAREIRAGSFSFSGFYWRRAWRLLPAAYATLAICIGVAPFLLTNHEMREFVAQVWGAVTFTANFVLWQQTGYFERAAELKLLLHVWSLSIEEQYYFVLPALLFFLRPSKWLAAAVFLTVCSLALCIFVTYESPAAAFYWLPTRAWEMGLGSVAAMLAPRLNAVSFRGKQHVGLLGLLAVAALALFPLSKVHPGIDAFIACVATVGLVLLPTVWLERGPAARVAAWVGDRSYSLYLVHWPIFALLHTANAGGGGVAWPIRVVAMFASVLIAWLIHRYVEQRFRGVGRSAPSKTLWLYLVIVGLALGGFASMVSYAKRVQSGYERTPGADASYGARCAYYTETELVSKCQNSESPDVLVWGDSHAIQLVPGLIAEGANVIEAARPMCAPLWSLSHHASEYNREWGKSCMKFNDQVFARLALTPSVKTVVLAGQWANQLTGKVLIRGATTLDIVDTSDQLVATALSETVAKIRTLGMGVVIVEPPPSADFDPRRCNERMLEGMWFFGASRDCRIDRASYEQKSAPMRAMIRNVEASSSVHIIRLAESMCGPSRCDTRWQDTILYQDGGHISYEGFAAVAKRNNVLNELRVFSK